MVVSDDPPTKKRRVEEGRDSAIREATGNLQYLGGYRQNRWMMGVEDPPGNIQTNANRNAAAHAENARRTQKPAVVTINLDEEEGAVENSNMAGTRSSPQPGATFLVNYEAPNMNMHQSRKSMEATARAQPSLPSPAPSEENTNSPTFAENQATALRNRGGQRNSTDTITATMSGPGSPMVMQSPLQGQQLHQRQQHRLQHISIPQNMAVPQAGPSPQFQFPQLPFHNLPQVQTQPQMQLQHPRQGEYNFCL